MNPDHTFIASHHIGGRGGTGSAQVPAPFAGDMQHVYYEADTDCTQQISTANHQSSRVTVLPICVGEKQGREHFHINYDPFMSSLLPLNPLYGDYTLFTIDPVKGPMDYCFSDTGRAMETRQVEVETLDNLYCGDVHPAQPPDFLSMDTQGSEYDILLGARETLASSVLALRLEVAFVPIYEEQKLFGDLCQLLAAQGFQFIKMLEVYEMFPTREPVGLRAGSVDAFGEALFFRTPLALNQAQDEQTRYLWYLKLAFIALVQGQLEYALACLRNLGPQPPELAAALAERTYPGFLQELARRVADHPRRFPPLFSEVYNFAQSMARFDGIRFATMEAHFSRIVAQLRKEVASLAGKRLCVLPFGLYGRQMIDLPQELGLAELVFFDNGWQKHQQAGLSVENPQLIGANDYVVILSQSYGAAIEKQITAIRGAQPERTISYQDLISGRHSFVQDGQSTPVEAWLEEHAFQALAGRIRQLRLAQTPLS